MKPLHSKLSVCTVPGFAFLLLAACAPGGGEEARTDDADAAATLNNGEVALDPNAPEQSELAGAESEQTSASSQLDPKSSPAPLPSSDWLVGTWSFEADNCSGGETTWGIIFDKDGITVSGEPSLDGGKWSLNGNALSIKTPAAENRFQIVKRTADQLTYTFEDKGQTFPVTLHKCG